MHPRNPRKMQRRAMFSMSLMDCGQVNDLIASMPCLVAYPKRRPRASGCVGWPRLPSSFAVPSPSSSFYVRRPSTERNGLLLCSFGLEAELAVDGSRPTSLACPPDGGSVAFYVDVIGPSQLLAARLRFPYRRRYLGPRTWLPFGRRMAALCFTCCSLKKWSRLRGARRDITSFAVPRWGNLNRDVSSIFGRFHRECYTSLPFSGLVRRLLSLNWTHPAGDRSRLAIRRPWKALSLLIVGASPEKSWDIVGSLIRKTKS